MRRVFGPRTVVEAAFLVAVPVAAAVLGAGMWTIIAASAVAYLLIFILEATLGREGAPAAGGPRVRIKPRTVTVKHPEPQASEPSSVVVRTDVAAGTLDPAGTTEPVPAFAGATPSEHVRVLRPEPSSDAGPEPSPPEPVPPTEPEPEPVSPPEPEPEPVSQPEPGRDVVRRYLAAVPLPVRKPEPPTLVPEPEPEPVPPAPERTTVVPIGVGSAPRKWNLWDLERLTREHGGDDAALVEERQFLLMYLREFADADGLLPVDFDGLVRDSFGELVGSS